MSEIHFNDPNGEFEAFIRRTVDNIYEPRETNDTACKIYFYPFSARFFSEDEWYDYIQKDEVTVKTQKIDWVIREGGKRLAEWVKTLDLSVETYLTVVVYGMVCDTPRGDKGNIDIAYHVSETGELSIDRLKAYRTPKRIGFQGKLAHRHRRGTI